MMNKKYLMKGFAALALVAGFSSCVKDVASVTPAEQEAQAKENAELQLGLNIPDGQTWDMASQVTADVTVNLGLDQEYTIAVYDKNPLYDSNAKFYAMETVKEGKTLSTSFTLPNALATVYIAAYDSKNRSVVSTATVENGQIVANLGGTAAGSRTMRAAEDAAVYPDYVKTLENYLNPASVVVDYNSYTVTEVSLTDMPNYTAITNAIITDDTSNGNHTLSDMIYIGEEGHFPGNGDGKHYRVAANTEVTEIFHINGTERVVNDAVIYVEGILHLNGNTLNGPTIVVASGGKIILDGDTNMSNAGRIIVMAGGSIEAAEGVTPAFNVNNGAACYNAGTINFNGQLNVNGSDTYNNGTIIVDVLRNTSGGKFTNFGHITARTNTIQGDAYNSTIVNGCYLRYTENAGTGPLTMLDNSRLDCDGQLYMTGTSTMYNLSEINAGSIYCQNVTINGPTAQGTFSIVKTTKFLVSHGGDLYVNNNAYVDCNPDEFYNYQNQNYKATMSKNDYNYSAAAWIINNNISHWTSENSSAIIIPEGDCTGMGNNPGGGGGKIYGDPAVYTYAFEDQIYNGDYDLNDVVLKITPHAVRNANKKITAFDNDQLDVKLVAAGATFNINAYIDDTPLFDGNEIHTALGVNAGVMVNTGNGTQGKDPVSCTIATPASIKSTNADGETVLNFSKLNVWIWVNKGSGAKSEQKIYYLVENAEKDENGNNIKKVAPYSIMIPYDWSWPTERTCITKAYKGEKISDDTYDASYSFAKWAETPDAERGTDENKKCLKWFEYPNGLTIKDVTATSAGTIK